nr:probable bifunctional SAT/APS kinase [Nerophis lumbriciformis]
MRALQNREFSTPLTRRQDSLLTAQTSTTRLIDPYGGQLVDLTIDRAELAEFRARAQALPTLTLSERSCCDLELLAGGAFSPLESFLGEADYQSVLDTLRLTSGQLMPVPVTLPVDADANLRLDSEVALYSCRRELLGTLRLDEIYPWDRRRESAAVFGTTDSRHPLVAEMHRWPGHYASGKLRMLPSSPPRDFRQLRLGPSAVRARLAALGRTNVVAFQTRNPLHRAHEELARRAIDAVDGTLLLHPTVGLTQPDDIDYFTRVRTYQAVVDGYLDPERVVLALLPLAMRMAGPREALWHALVRRNFGANHLIVGRDHASPGLDSGGQPFYPPYAAQELLDRHGDELGVAAVPFNELVYLPEQERYEESSKVGPDTPTLALSGSQVRDYLSNGRRLPAWFTRAEVADILESAHPRYRQQGACIWFTGLSGSGKSTTAEELAAALREGGRTVTVLDGDVIRTHLSKGLGFSPEDRDTNIRRIGFVASQIVAHGGLVICAAISPYRATRDEVRSMFKAGCFLEIFVDTPLIECERRDTKGLYARARSGELKNFTGIDDPYQDPLDPEIVLDTLQTSPKVNAERILGQLRLSQANRIARVEVRGPRGVSRTPKNVTDKPEPSTEP